MYHHLSDAWDNIIKIENKVELILNLSLKVSTHLLTR